MNTGSGRESGTLSAMYAGPVPSPAPQSAFRRLIASVLFFLAAILAGIAAFTPWWTIAASGTVNESFSFFPGSSYSEVNGAHGATMFYTYSSHADLASLAGLYEGVLGLLLAALVLGLVVGIVGLVVSFGRLPGFAQNHAVRWLAIVLIVLLAVAIAVVPSLQPGLITGCSSTGSTECNSFWGSTSTAGLTSTWGSGLGWYLAIGAVAALVAGFFVWGRNRPRSVPTGPWGAPPTPVPPPPRQG
jgi:hypothetical protein